MKLLNKQTKNIKKVKKTQFSNIIFQCWLSSERLIKSPIVTGNLFSDGNMPTTPGENENVEEN